MSEIEVINPSLQNHSFEPLDQTDDQIFQMDQLQKTIDPYLNELGAPQDPPQRVDPKLAQEALATVNEIREFYGEKPITNASVTRRLLTLLNRIAALVENHLFYKKEKNHKEEAEIKDEKLPNLQSWTRWQGGVHGLSAFGSPFLLLAAALIPNEGVREALKGITGMTQPAANAASQLIESWKMDDQYKKDLHLNTAQSKKQGEEGLKNLPLQIQQLIQKLLDQNQQMVRSTGQRG